MEPPSKRPRVPPPAYRFGLLPPDVFEKLGDEFYYTHGGNALGSFLAKLDPDPVSKARGTYYCAKLANRLKMRVRTIDLAESSVNLQSVADSVRARLDDPKPEYCSICGAWHPGGQGLVPTPSPLQEFAGIAPDIRACSVCWRDRYSMTLTSEHSPACLKAGDADHNAIKYGCDLCLMKAFPDGYASGLGFPGTFDSMRRTCEAVHELIGFERNVGLAHVPVHWKPIALMWADRQRGKTARDIQESFIRHFVFLAGQSDNVFAHGGALAAEKLWRSKLAQ